jgi:hypothetical protein
MKLVGEFKMSVCENEVASQKEVITIVFASMICKLNDLNDFLISHTANEIILVGSGRVETSALSGEAVFINHLPIILIHVQTHF